MQWAMATGSGQGAATSTVQPPTLPDSCRASRLHPRAPQVEAPSLRILLEEYRPRRIVCALSASRRDLHTPNFCVCLVLFSTVGLPTGSLFYSIAIASSAAQSSSLLRQSQHASATNGVERMRRCTSTPRRLLPQRTRSRAHQQLDRTRDTPEAGQLKHRDCEQKSSQTGLSRSRLPRASPAIRRAKVANPRRTMQRQHQVKS